MVRIPKADRRPKKLAAYFFETAAGAQPVREWLLAMNDDDRKIVGDDLATAEFGWPVGMPVCRAMGGGLFELRSGLTGNRIARVLFFTTRDRLVLLHGFEKKTRKTPASDLALAKKRMKEIEE